MRLVFVLSAFLTACSTVTPGSAILAVDVVASSEVDRYSLIRGGRYWSSPNGTLGLSPLVIPPVKRAILWLAELPGVYRKSMEEAKKVQAEREEAEQRAINEQLRH